MALALDPRFVVELAPRPGHAAPPHDVFVRRRVAAALAAVVSLLLVLGGVFAAGRVLAGRGGVPASAPAAQPVQTAPYVVQPGDTLWSIAQRFRGERSLAGYVDALVHANEGPDIRVGERLVLP
jgi:LysM domain-containing protein